MAALLEEERRDIDGQLIKYPDSQQRQEQRRKRKLKLKSKRANITTNDAEDDSEGDGDFSASDSEHTSSTGPESNDSNGVVAQIPNDEVADLLPSKTAPKTKRMKATTHTKKKSRAVEVREVGDDDSPHSLPTRNSLASPQLGQGTEGTVKQNPIYLFYEVVCQNASGMVGDPGDKHYKCYHGNRKVLTITRAMKSSLNGMHAFKTMPFLCALIPP
ncbi:hypothetical protein V8E53_011573 [Lactarius tabidus]